LLSLLGALPPFVALFCLFSPYEVLLKFVPLGLIQILGVFSNSPLERASFERAESSSADLFGYFFFFLFEPFFLREHAILPGPSLVYR